MVDCIAEGAASEWRQDSKSMLEGHRLHEQPGPVWVPIERNCGCGRRMDEEGEGRMTVLIRKIVGG